MKVAPGGTEEIEETVYEGVVTTVLPDVSRQLLAFKSILKFIITVVPVPF